MPAPLEEQRLSNPFARALGRWRAQSRTRRELLTLVFALALGVLVLPWLIWAAGKTLLGPYAHGGPLHLWGDFFAGLEQGSPAFWFVAMGPLLFLVVFRLVRFGLRAGR